MLNRTTLRFALLFVFLQLSVMSHREIPFRPNSSLQSQQQHQLASQANALIARTNNGKRTQLSSDGLYFVSLAVSSLAYFVIYRLSDSLTSSVTVMFTLQFLFRWYSRYLYLVEQADLDRSMKLIRITKTMADCDSSAPESIESIFCSVVFRYIRSSEELNKLFHEIPKKNITALDALEDLFEFLFSDWTI